MTFQRRDVRDLDLAHRIRQILSITALAMLFAGTLVALPTASFASSPAANLSWTRAWTAPATSVVSAGETSGGRIAVLLRDETTYAMSIELLNPDSGDVESTVAVSGLSLSGDRYAYGQGVMYRDGFVVWGRAENSPCYLERIALDGHVSVTAQIEPPNVYSGCGLASSISAFPTAAPAGTIPVAYETARLNPADVARPVVVDIRDALTLQRLGSTTLAPANGTDLANYVQGLLAPTLDGGVLVAVRVWKLFVGYQPTSYLYRISKAGVISETVATTAAPGDSAETALRQPICQDAGTGYYLTLDGVSVMSARTSLSASALWTTPPSGDASCASSPRGTWISTGGAVLDAHSGERVQDLPSSGSVRPTRAGFISRGTFLDRIFVYKWNEDAPPPPPTRINYVALGDSFSSGEGNAPFDPNTDVFAIKPSPGKKPQDQLKSERLDGCHRSELGWPRQLGATLNWHLACSGATVSDLYHGQEKLSPDNTGQLARLGAIESTLRAVGDKVDLVTLTIGGNDDEVGFASILGDCFLRECLAHFDKNMDKIDKLKPKIVKALLDIKRAAPSARVVLVGYPRLFPLDQSNNVTCGWLTPLERSRANTIATYLDALLRSAAADGGATFVSVLNAVDGHELCAADSWMFEVNPLVWGLDQRQGHPIYPGQRSIARIVASQLGMTL